MKSVCLFAALVGCSDSSILDKAAGVECGEGTAEIEGVCVPLSTSGEDTGATEALDTGPAADADADADADDTGQQEVLDPDEDGDGVTVGDGDCDDDSATTFPGAEEVCDGVDNDCDGAIDEDATDASTWFLDYDGDGFGNVDWPLIACEPSTGYVPESGDCDDTASGVFPGAEELCDSVDNDCDGETDEGLLVAGYLDRDGDGFGDDSTLSEDCSSGSDRVGVGGDCDDGDASVHPGADEICDRVDNDCDGVTDTDAIDPTTWYLDHDVDGYGDSAWPMSSCDAPSGYVADSTDCNDFSADDYPGADEVCDGRDNDCDSVVDEGEMISVFIDSDRDGWGFGATLIGSCDAMDGYSFSLGDCDDADAETFPGAVDEPYDGVDADCVGDDDFDDDGDGYVPDAYVGAETEGVAGSGMLPGGDCDDADPDRNPGMEEVEGDGIDSDCDGSDSLGLSGEWGDAWVDASPGGAGVRGLQEYLQEGADYLYVGNSSAGFWRMNMTTEGWESLAHPPGSLANWGSAALANDDGYWQIRTSSAYRYDVPTNSWSTVSGVWSSGDEQSMTITDRDGVLWAYQGGSSLVSYDPTAGEMEVHSVIAPPSVYETRLAYDEPTHSIYFGGFADDEVYRYDITTGTTDTGLMRHPEGFLNDIFCGDRNGHLYAAGGSGGSTIWQYDIATDVWVEITPYPTDHGNNGSCSVSMDGWLFVEPGSVTTLYKLPLY